MSQHYLETMYKRSDLISKAHQRRLRNILASFRQFVPDSAESWADFGCSTGYIISYLLSQGELPFQKIVGYDKNKNTVNEANGRGIPNTKFYCRDLNDRQNPRERYDIVSCFETLEHVPDFCVALSSLFDHIKPKGFLFVTIPNELGLIGFVKFLGRMIARRNAYEDFFCQRSRLVYVSNVLTHRSIGQFRRYQPTGYGPHLGFDYREVVKHVDNDYLKTGKLLLVHTQNVGWNTSKLLILRRVTELAKSDCKPFDRVKVIHVSGKTA